MDYQDFMEAQQAQWPLGKLETWHQVHPVAPGSTLWHPLQESDFLRAAGFVQITISRPRSCALPLTDIRVFTQKIADLAPEDAQLCLAVEDAEAGQDGIAVRLLAARWAP